ncbi:MAG: sigma-70 family RNA polymerase sigma factor [Gammaproteobacteria bacterium]
MPARPPANPDFEALATAHLDSAYNLARWLVRDPALADDVVQDAMLRALKYFPGFRGDNARAWVLQIVRNVALTRLKDGSAARVVELAAADDVLEAASIADASADRLADTRAGEFAATWHTSSEPEATLMREEDERLVQRLLAAVPVELRECLVLREIEELSYKEIARIIDVPVGTVMSRLWRGRKLLAEAAAGVEQA